jgi:DNA polymerase-1
LKRILLIDGDIVAFKFAAANEHAIEWDAGVFTAHADLDSAKANVDEHIKSLCIELKADDYVIALSDTENFRKDLCPSYKSHRVDAKQPLIRRLLEDHLREAHAAKQKPRLEGDDVLGIIATNPKLYPKCEKIIVSDDKDMQTIPCTLYRQGELRRVSLVEADLYHLTQTLTGDRTDGYPGLPGTGPKKAERILQAEVDRNAHLSGTVRHCCWEGVVAAYVKRGLTEEDALLQARLARILRHEDYDYQRKEPILWQPK